MHSYLTVRVSEHSCEDFTQPFQLHPTADQQQTQLDRIKNEFILQKHVHPFCSWPEGALILQECLQTQQTLLSLRPVGTGATIQHLHELQTHTYTQRPVDTSTQRKIMILKHIEFDDGAWNWTSSIQGSLNLGATWQASPHFQQFWAEPLWSIP